MSVTRHPVTSPQFSQKDPRFRFGFDPFWENMILPSGTGFEKKHDQSHLRNLKKIKLKPSLKRTATLYLKNGWLEEDPFLLRWWQFIRVPKYKCVCSQKTCTAENKTSRNTILFSNIYFCQSFCFPPKTFMGRKQDSLIQLDTLIQIMSGWWFHIFFMFTPIWGRFPIWRAYFSEGLVQPPTRYCLCFSLNFPEMRQLLDFFSKTCCSRWWKRNRQRHHGRASVGYIRCSYTGMSQKG